MQSRMNVC